MREILVSFAVILVCGLLLVGSLLWGSESTLADGSAQTTGQSVTQIAAAGDINVESWDKVAETLKFDPQEYPLADAQTTDSGLRYIDLKVGEGPTPSKGQTVKVDYTGVLGDGTKFDSSLNPGRKPIEFPIMRGNVIKGWDEGVGSMNTGGQRILVIPPELGYGARGAGRVIPGNATLIFRVNLISAG
ncbi:MAG: FKBP-type peptidyl-prolyl cis-trans isomerase [Cyanobacteria bacterium P01_H01_bin.15]